MTIPTQADWEGHLDHLDVACAYGNFHGKTLEEAYALFVENALRYQEDIMFMPAPCFYYYVQAYMSYLLSLDSRGDSDGASAFFGIVQCRKDDIRQAPPFVRERIRTLLHRLSVGQAWYNAPEKIYGNFRVKANRVLKLISE